jgi:transitional endoplasmic reticulum ATPase
MADAEKKSLTKMSKTEREMVAKLMLALGIEGDPLTYVAEVIRSGDKVILPEDADIPDIIKVLQRKHDEENQKIRVNTEVEVPPWDGARALNKAMEEELGVVVQNETFSWLTGRVPPQEIEVEVELNKTMTIKWGEFQLTGMGEDAVAMTSIGMSDQGQQTFKVSITCKRRFQTRARKLLDTMRQIAMKESLHKGKAFSIRFHDNANELIALPTPKFFALDVEQPLFRRDLEHAIERNVFVPMRYTQDLRDMGESLKRGVLFAGEYGVGKTMLAGFIAREAIKLGWTFVYVKNAAELPMALAYAKKYQPVVVFAEDVDRVAGIERTNQVNDLLNQLDGVDSKTAAIMTILTSNHMKQVNPAMRRPGRIDLVLQVLPPDGETIGRMVHHFSRQGLEPGADLGGITTQLEGLAPAYVKEAVGRARLEALRRTGSKDSLINGDDLEAVAKEVKDEKNLFTLGDGAADPTHIEKVASGFAAAADVLRRGTKPIVAPAAVTKQ